jgi:hypothetical protein
LSAALWFNRLNLLVFPEGGASEAERGAEAIGNQIDVTPMELRVTLASLDRNPFAEPYEKRGAIVTTENFESEFRGFSGGASGFGDPEFVEFLRNESVVPGTGLSVGALQ